MKIRLLALFFLIISCKNKTEKIPEILAPSDDVILAFGSCNHQNLPNDLWDDVLSQNPSHWIWGGDIIYGDSDDMSKLKGDYDSLLANNGYKNIVEKLDIHGTWDDHDYGLNDGGEEFEMKGESQQVLLDFLGVPEQHTRRDREGVYYSSDIVSPKGSINLIVLDTRYFRTALTPSSNPDDRYGPSIYGEGTTLGEAQWQWLTEQLNSSKADFNLIVSSIQFLSSEHGFEKWANMPHEVDRLNNVIKTSNAKGVLILSGDRHISEYSKSEIDGMDYPLIDFTSSGLTHTYTSFDGEPNKYRIGEVVFDKSFGLLKFDFKSKTVTMQMRGNNNEVQQELIQQY